MDGDACTKTIVAYINDDGIRKRVELQCDGTCANCLDKRVWGNGEHVAAGVKAVATAELKNREISGVVVDASMEGKCSKERQS